MAIKRVVYWGSGSTPAWRVLIALEEKGLPYESKVVEFSKGEHKSPEIFALNPRGQVPTFVDDGVIVNESLAVLLYLEDAYPEKPLMPEDKKMRGVVYQRVVEANNLQAALTKVIRIVMFQKPIDQKQLSEALNGLKEELKYWEKYAAQGFMAGSEYTLADIAVGPIVLGLKRFGLTFKNHPNLGKYAEKVEARPAWSKTYPPHWRESPNREDLSVV